VTYDPHRFSGSIIIAGSAAPGSFLDGTPVVLKEDPQIAESGWDSMTVAWALRRATLTPEELSALFPTGSQYGARNWWVTGGKPVCMAPGVWTADIQYKGFASLRPAKINWGAAAEQQSADNIAIGATTYAKVSTHEATNTMSVQWICPNVYATSAVPSDHVGRAFLREVDPVTGSPLAVPSLAPEVWSYLTSFVYHWPNGWVLEDCQADILAGSGAALITENYKYIRAVSP